MSGYILCQVKRAKNPYYISNISTNIYSIEELCYYLYHNIYLLDETIINEQLLVWMKEELHLRRLYQRLYVLLEEKKNIGEFILPIFKEINYLSHDQFREMNERLKRFEEQPEIVRKKIKGDYLVDHEKYINAIQVYQETLKDTEENETNMGSQFTGSIYNNMGCAYASLFQMNEALTCFQKANEELHTKASLKSWLFAVYMSKGQDAYEQMCTERKVTFREAYAALQIANMEIGITNVQTVSYTVPVEESIRIKTRSIMGVEIPLVEADPSGQAPTYAYYSTKESLDQARQAFEKVKDLTLNLSMIENSAYRLAAAIKKTQKRANALKNITIPHYTQLSKDIADALEEKEREEFTRLKVIKQRKNKAS